ncbi:MAG: helix-hairpin-helix domain-containing protein [Candidatus Omnitrophica bacterium]|nr:helix-hairpin-helix domain-containing protein [Candidatus Omnitrophota bacterium]MDD5500056.1 helix-hairpin-helix domain-containing protein [Candidatus Omnitrophota bacterium]
MAYFTREERKAFLFLALVLFCGTVLNLAFKLNCRMEQFFCSRMESVKIDLNKSSAEELFRTGKISRRMSQRIVDYRLECGDFESLEALKKVKGIGEKNYEKFKAILFVE